MGSRSAHADRLPHLLWLDGRVLTSAWAAQQKNMNVYATAHLSGDVANAVTLLKRMTRPSSRKHKAGLLIPSADLAACQVPVLSMEILLWRSIRHVDFPLIFLSGWLYSGQIVSRIGFNLPSRDLRA